MPKRKAGLSFDDVKRLAAAYPEVEESPWYGTRALKVRGRGFARLKEDGESMVLRVPFVVRDHLMRAKPDVFYITDHYRGYPAVLVRLPKADRQTISDLLEDAWRSVAPVSLVKSFDA